MGMDRAALTAALVDAELSDGQSRRGGAITNGTRRHSTLDSQVAAPLLVFLTVDVTSGIAFFENGESR